MANRVRTIHPAATRASGLLRLARLAWVGLAAFYPLLWLACLPAFIQRATTGTVPLVVRSGGELASNALFQTWAASWGLSVADWVWVHLLLTAVSLLVFYGMAALIWTRVRTWFGWLTAMVFVLVGSSTLGPAVHSAQPAAGIEALFELGALVWPFFFVWLYLFPDGQWVPRRLLWVFVPLVAAFFTVFVLYVGSSHIPLLEDIRTFLVPPESSPKLALFLPALALVVLVAQVYRYRYVSGPVERAQTRWFLVGLALVGLPIVFTSSSGPPNEVDTLQLAVLPVAVGIAILRYRLWDVDVIIRRTLVYGTLSALLALAFLGLVVLLQRLSVLLVGQESPVATVTSTLAIVVLFNPLRRRVQSFVDRRFYRKKYDSQQVLARFAAVTRDETDIARLAGALTKAAEETVQPVNVSVWLRPVGVGAGSHSAGAAHPVDRANHDRFIPVDGRLSEKRAVLVRSNDVSRFFTAKAVTTNPLRQAAGTSFDARSRGDRRDLAAAQPLRLPVTGERAVRSTTPPHTNRWLRMIWLALFVALVGVFLAGIPVTYRQMLAAPPAPLNDDVTPTAVKRILADAGLPLTAYAGYIVLRDIPGHTLLILVGLLIFLRRGAADHGALVISFLLLGGLGGPVAQAVFGTMGEWGMWAGRVTMLTSAVASAALFFVFPDGRFVPRWTRWVLVAFTLLVTISFLAPDSPLNLIRFDGSTGLLVLLPIIASLVYAQVYRYRRVSGPIKRLQSRWGVLGLLALPAAWLIGGVLSSLAPGLTSTSAATIRSEIVLDLLVFQPLYLLFPIGLGIALLKHRLYDIDIVIRKTLTYSAITAVLALTFLGMVVALQGLSVIVTGQESPVATVVSTLVIAVLFSPLRRRVQSFVDRRFFRQKYDAQQVLAHFAAAVRDETDMDRLANTLAEATRHTMEPAYVNMWLPRRLRGDR